MKKIILDGDYITDISDIHKIFVSNLEFPSYYGYNLDALYDCLTDVSEKVVIKIKNREKLLYELGHYAEKLFVLLEDVTEVNDNIYVEF